MFFGLNSLFCSVQETVSAVEGQDVTLPCEAPNNKTIRAVSWTRLDLKEDQFVFLYRDGHFDPDNHPSYKNRVQLKDRLFIILYLTLFLSAGDSGRQEGDGGREDEGGKDGERKDGEREDGDGEDRWGGVHVGPIFVLAAAALVFVVMSQRNQKNVKWSLLLNDYSDQEHFIPLNY
uniref:Immunoglobulin V-set domain-containing protein n=1 Tax=Salarias fasciatus TaxID=181472 RepID=A0A672F945_SALFA